MVARRLACALVLGCTSFTSGLAEGPNPWAGIVRGPVGSSEEAGRLTHRQVELVRRVNDYLNQLPMLQGSFMQTSAEGKQQRGKFHITRPGRFRFDFAPPTRVVIISDGKHLAIQDYGLNTDDRKDLSQTPFRPLVRPEVDLMRDALISDVSESDDTITIAFTDTNAQAGSVKLFLGTKPAIQLKGWIIRDNQRLDTRVDLTEVQPVGRIDQRLFDLSSRLERTQW
jgi:outer membrane lipoprotein-sorting protein